MEDLVTINVDGRELRAPKGELLWEACKRNGIDIPIFCYHTKLGAVGACRTCLVEMEGQAKGPITACSTPVSDGMVIHTRSPIVEKAQRGVMEFLLLNHPLDCPICDRGGECPLQDQVFSYGPGTSRYIEPKRHHVKPIALGPTIALDRERCVLCWRCVRFCAEIAEDKSIVLLDRGDHSMVGTFQEQPYVSNFSGNVVELCPVGALTSRKQRFNFRPWELQNRPSICPHCPVGCNINVSVRKNDEVIRFLSRDNPEVDDSWLCDRGRFSFEFVNSPERLRSPLIRREGVFEETSWSEALEFIADRLVEVVEASGPDAVAGIASPRLTNEDLYIFRRFMRDIVGTGAIDHHPRPQLALTTEQQRAREALDAHLMAISDLNDAKTIVLLGADPSEREPVLELRIRQAVNKRGAKLVVINAHEITLSAKADRTLFYAPHRFAELTRALATEVAEARSRVEGADTGDAPANRRELKEIAESCLADGPVAILYDDTFDGVTDKGDALLSVAELVDALRRVDVGTMPMLDDCNSMGARDLDILPTNEAGGSWGRPVLSRLLDNDGTLRAAFLLGSNVVSGEHGEDVARAMQRLDLVVVHELFLTDTAKLADVILPAASFAEKRGTFTSTERRVQALSDCVPSPGLARSDWEILVDLSQYFETPLDYALPQHIWDEISNRVPVYAGVRFAEIGTTGVRPRLLQRV